MAFNLNKNSESNSKVDLSKKASSNSKFDLTKGNIPSEKLASGKSSPELKKGEEKKKSKAWIFILLSVVIIVVQNNNTSTTKADNNTPDSTITANTNAVAKDTATPKTTTENSGQNTDANKENPVTNKTNSTSQKYVKGTSYDVYHFASGSPQISGTDPKLDEMYIYLKENPKASIQITGYTDNIGSEELNLNLSKQRASSVFNYLVAKGIDAGRMRYSGKGLANPVADNSTEEGRLKNRRAEFEITN